MPGRLSERTVLTPASHPGIYKPRIGGEAFVWSQPQSLHHTRAQSFNQHVGLGAGIAAKGKALFAFEIDGYTVARALDHGVGHGTAWTINPHHLCAKVCQQHRDVGSGTDPGKFDNLQATQRTCNLTVRLAHTIGNPPLSEPSLKQWSIRGKPSNCAIWVRSLS